MTPLPLVTERGGSLYCGLESVLFDRQYELYEYDGLLFIDPGATAGVRSFLAASGFQAGEFDGRTLEITYAGRDANRWFVSWLKQLAEVVRSAAGEITCTIATGDGDPLFEFFRIADGKLVRQRGWIVRGEPELPG